MRNLATKEQILQDAGYTYNFDRELYLNRKAKKAFSVKFVEDRSEEEIQSCIREDTDRDKEWHFFFVDPPSDIVKRQLANVLG